MRVNLPVSPAVKVWPIDEEDDETIVSREPMGADWSSCSVAAWAGTGTTTMMVNSRVTMSRHRFTGAPFVRLTRRTEHPAEF
jgi:hypothetical protein